MVQWRKREKTTKFYSFCTVVAVAVVVDAVVVVGGGGVKSYSSSYKTIKIIFGEFTNVHLKSFEWFNNMHACSKTKKDLDSFRWILGHEQLYM